MELTSFDIGSVRGYNVFVPPKTRVHVVDILFAYVPTTLIGAKLGGAGKEA
ncbi:MAG TPA: hypothetical protein PLK77_05995 [Pyrinomonadaceae bacterium]|nr:hypothetical protein [Pyrinomonadaceae bacterium]